MPEFTFIVVLKIDDALRDDAIEALGAAGCMDALAMSGEAGYLVLEFCREAASLEAARLSAARDVMRAIPGAEFFVLVKGEGRFIDLSRPGSAKTRRHKGVGRCGMTMKQYSWRYLCWLQWEGKANFLIRRLRELLRNHIPQQNKSGCPVCFEGHLERKSKRITDTYKGHAITYDQPGDWCDQCGEGILSGDDAQATEKQLLAWRKKIDQQEI